MSDPRAAKIVGNRAIQYRLVVIPSGSYGWSRLRQRDGELNNGFSEQLLSVLRGLIGRTFICD